jgi:hypothetical protein
VGGAQTVNSANEALKKMFDPKEYEVRGEWRVINNEKREEEGLTGRKK